MKKRINYYKPLPRNQKKSLITKPQKIVWAATLATVAIAGIPELVTTMYNYVNGGDSSEIKFQQKEELFPDQNLFDENKNEEAEKQENVNSSYNYLKASLRPQIQEKLGFEIEGDFDVLGVAEINLMSDSFDSKDTRLCVFVKPENGGMFCVYYNNRYSQMEIAISGSQSDVISSLIAHLQSSSIESFSIVDEFSDSLIQNLPEQNIMLVDGARTYIEKSGEKSYMIPVFVQNDENICVKTYKVLKSEIDSISEASEQDVSLEQVLQEALASVLFGDEVQLMEEYVNKKQSDLSHVNEVLNEIRNDKTQTSEPNKDLFPDDEFEFLESEMTK